jgi:hypothetical protein
MPFTPKPDDRKYLARTVVQIEEPVSSRTTARKRGSEEHITRQRQFELFRQSQTYEEYLASIERTNIARVQQLRTPTPEQEPPSNIRRL